MSLNVMYSLNLATLNSSTIDIIGRDTLVWLLYRAMVLICGEHQATCIDEH